MSRRAARPALVVSNDVMNRFCSLAMVCPVTHTDRGSPLHVPLDGRTKTDGFILCDQVRMLDLKARNAGFVERRRMTSLPKWWTLSSAWWRFPQ